MALRLRGGRCMNTPAWPYESELSKWRERRAARTPTAPRSAEHINTGSLMSLTQVVCRHLGFDSSVSDYKLLQGVSEAARVYYNYTGTTACLNTSSTATGSLGFLGWYYQACTEMVMPLCTDGVQDMFEPQAWDFQAFSDECQALFGVRPRASWAETQYGGKDLSAHSNIIFSNGGLDPWSGGGVTRNISDSVVAIVIPQGAHHLDLRYDNERDPPAVRRARALEVDYFKAWVRQARRAP
ncbi:unnamed protein product [Boreogadus saida]